MMTTEELTEFRTPCQYICGKFIPCVVVISHMEALAEVERLKAEVEKLKEVVEKAHHDLGIGTVIFDGE